MQYTHISVNHSVVDKNPRTFDGFVALSCDVSYARLNCRLASVFLLTISFEDRT